MGWTPDTQLQAVTIVCGYRLTQQMRTQGLDLTLLEVVQLAQRCSAAILSGSEWEKMDTWYNSVTSLWDPVKQRWPSELPKMCPHFCSFSQSKLKQKESISWNIQHIQNKCFINFPLPRTSITIVPQNPVSWLARQHKKQKVAIRWQITYKEHTPEIILQEKSYKTRSPCKWATQT